MTKEIPAIIKEVGFDFRWDNKKVWALDLPIETIDINELLWHFDVPFWWENGGYYNLKPQSVFDDREKYRDRITRIMNADTTYPLDVMEWKGRLLLLDGLHRLAKHYLQDNKTINIRKVPQENIKDILK